MKVKGFINIYPSTEMGTQGFILHKSDSQGNHIESEVRTGCGVFPTKSAADLRALPSRLIVAEFEYDKVVTVTRYRNVYQGDPSEPLSSRISTGVGTYDTEEAAKASLNYGNSPWKPFHIGVMRFTKEL